MGAGSMTISVGDKILIRAGKDGRVYATKSGEPSIGDKILVSGTKEAGQSAHVSGSPTIGEKVLVCPGEDGNYYALCSGGDDPKVMYMFPGNAGMYLVVPVSTNDEYNVYYIPSGQSYNNKITELYERIFDTTVRGGFNYDAASDVFLQQKYLDGGKNLWYDRNTALVEKCVPPDYRLKDYTGLPSPHPGNMYSRMDMSAGNHSFRGVPPEDFMRNRWGIGASGDYGPYEVGIKGSWLSDSYVRTRDDNAGATMSIYSEDAECFSTAGIISLDSNHTYDTSAIVGAPGGIVRKDLIYTGKSGNTLTGIKSVTMPSVDWLHPPIIYNPRELVYLVSPIYATLTITNKKIENGYIYVQLSGPLASYPVTSDFNWLYLVQYSGTVITKGPSIISVGSPSSGWYQVNLHYNASITESGEWFPPYPEDVLPEIGDTAYQIYLYNYTYTGTHIQAGGGSYIYLYAHNRTLYTTRTPAQFRLYKSTYYTGITTRFPVPSGYNWQDTNNDQVINAVSVISGTYVLFKTSKYNAECIRLVKIATPGAMLTSEEAYYPDQTITTVTNSEINLSEYGDFFISIVGYKNYVFAFTVFKNAVPHPDYYGTVRDSGHYTAIWRWVGSYFTPMVFPTGMDHRWPAWYATNPSNHMEYHLSQSSDTVSYFCIPEKSTMIDPQTGGLFITRGTSFYRITPGEQSVFEIYRAFIPCEIQLGTQYDTVSPVYAIVQFHASSAWPTETTSINIVYMKQRGHDGVPDTSARYYRRLQISEGTWTKIYPET